MVEAYRFGYFGGMGKPRIAELRAKHGLSQSDLAAKLSTSHVQISRLENGGRRLTLEWMQRIARALDCKVSDLLADDDVNDRLSTDERILLRQLRENEMFDPFEILAIMRALMRFIEIQAERKMTTGQLAGNPALAANMAEAWANLTDGQRASALELIYASAKLRGGMGAVA